MTTLHYAVGDIHGRDDLLEKMHARILADHRKRHGDAAATIVYVGDYIDRGPDGVAVIDRLMRGLDGFDLVCLKGNHEAMMLSCTETKDHRVWLNWLSNGGDTIIRKLGLDIRFGKFDPQQLVEGLGAERMAWLQALPVHHKTPDYLFVHAGIAPGVPIEEQKEKDLLWIRGAFLNSDVDHGVVVVHGHTPAEEPEIRPNRVGIDTGAFLTGRLTAVVLGEQEGPRFLTVEGKPADLR